MASAQGVRPGTSHEAHETETTKRMLDNLIHQVRKNIGTVKEPRAQALFETTAEVLGGLKTAYEHYEQGSEAAFRH